jgi:predicted hotdog family 3-hydroxylacyl-ACP dehydratase
MRLLEQVAAWDDQSIRCVTHSHRSPDNPLRDIGGLAAAHAIEYAAQAAAVHGILCGKLDGGPELLLAAARDLILHRRRLDDLPDELRVDARLQVRVGAGARYGFLLTSGESHCVSGIISMMPHAGAWP